MYNENIHMNARREIIVKKLLAILLATALCLGMGVGAAAAEPQKAQPQANTYYITFNGNGANVTGLPGMQAKVEGVALTLSSDRPTRPDYTFKGWATNPSGVVVYNPGDAYTKDADATLYAVWDDVTYSVEYKENGTGVTNMPATQLKVQNVNLTLSTTRPQRSGYTFQGWATSSSGPVAYSAGSIYSANASITLYAVWAATTTYTVHYDGNAIGATNVPADQVKVQDVALALTTQKPNLSGYTFQGWATSPNGGVAYTAGGSYTANASITLYAVWAASSVTYTVRYDANGSGVTNLPADQVKVQDVTLTLSTQRPSRSGYTFQGWATSPNGAVAYTPGGSYIANASVTLYAIWQSNGATPGGRGLFYYIWRVIQWILYIFFFGWIWMVTPLF
jgi:uncharacterized repeat protein (TIGR02543 family)